MKNQQKVVLITGCSSGLGRALAIALYQKSNNAYKVVATARRLESLEEVSAMGISTVALDVTSDSSVAAAVAEITKSHKRIDVLLNNAGISRFGPVVEQPLEEAREVFETNYFGVIRMLQAVVPVMKHQHSGLIINIGSVVSQLTTPFSSAYSSSKAALLALSDAMRLEVAPFNIKVSYVVAGSIKSSFGDNSSAGAAYERYESSKSVYNKWSEAIRARAQMSQREGSQSAEQTAEQIIAIIDKRYASPPTWFFAGGSAMYFWSMGLLQKVWGWPTNNVLLKKFSLQEEK